MSIFIFDIVLIRKIDSINHVDLKGDTMKRRGNNFMIKMLCSLLLVVGIGFTLTRGPNYKDIRTMGMGNTTVSVTTDRTSIFHNPAGLSMIDRELQFSFSPIAVGIDGIFATILKQMSKHGSKLSNLDKVDNAFIDMINEYDGQWVGLEYIPEITVAKENLGFGIYSVFPLGVRIESGHLIPKLGLRGQRDLVFTWGVGVPLRHKENLCGISVEYVQRTPLQMITTYTETFLLFDNIASNPFGIIGDYSKVQHGVSFDVGFMHNVQGWRFAWGIKDILGVVGGDIVTPPQLDLGVAYYFPQLEDVPAIKNLIIAAEITDLFGFEPVTKKFIHFPKKLHFGAEIDMHYAAFRIGLSQGYPSAGVGLKFGMFKADYAYFTEEVGYYAGQLDKNKHVISLGIDFTIKQDGDRQHRIDPGDLYNKAMTLYTLEKYYEALFIFGKILTEYPEFFKNDRVHLFLSLCEEHLDMREVAKENFGKAKTNFPKSDIIPLADLGLMRIHYRDSNSTAVAEQFSKLTKGSVSDSLKYHAYYYQAQSDIRDNKPSRAISLLKDIPSNHPQNIYALHSLAVAYAQADSMHMASKPLFDVVQLTPKNKAEEELINRSFLFIGYIFYDGLGINERSLPKAVTALRKVPVTSMYYEDALLGLAWCALTAQQWADCLESCKKIKELSKKPVLHCEALLLEGYIHIMNKKYKEAQAVLAEADAKLKSIVVPSDRDKSAPVLEYSNNRRRYADFSRKINSMALTNQSSMIIQQIDSLKVPQVEAQKRLTGYHKFMDDFIRRAFFARNLQNVRDDVSYAIIKVENIIQNKDRDKTIDKAVKQTEQIDDEMNKLQKELEKMDKGKKEEPKGDWDF